MWQPRCCAHGSNVVTRQLHGTCRWRHGRLTPELDRCCDAASTEHKRQAAQGKGRKAPRLSHPRSVASGERVSDAAYVFVIVLLGAAFRRRVFQ